MPDEIEVGSTILMEQRAVEAGGGLERTDAAIELARAKLREIDDKIEEMRQSPSNPAFTEIAGELDRCSLSGVTIIKELAVRSHQLLSNLTRRRRCDRR
jgi:hypothetical protein